MHYRMGAAAADLRMRWAAVSAAYNERTWRTRCSGRSTWRRPISPMSATASRSWATASSGSAEGPGAAVRAAPGPGALDGDDRNRLEVVAHRNRQLAGWAAVYQYTDHTAWVFRRVDHAVFWQLARWVARKYRSGVARELQRAVRAPQPGVAKTWVVAGRWPDGHGGCAGGDGVGRGCGGSGSGVRGLPPRPSRLHRFTFGLRPGRRAVYASRPPSRAAPPDALRRGRLPLRRWEPHPTLCS